MVEEKESLETKSPDHHADHMSTLEVAEAKPLMVGGTIPLSIESTSSSLPSRLQRKPKKKSLIAASLFINFCVLHYFLFSLLLKPYYNASSQQINHPIFDVSNYKHSSDHQQYVVGQCTEKQMKGIESALEINSETLEINKDKVKCPSSSWLDEYYSLLYRKYQENPNWNLEPFLGINVGCNKGYDAINLARLGMLNPKFDRDTWGQALVNAGLADVGVCGQSQTQNQFQLSSALSGHTVRKGEMHCIEPMPSTFEAINKVKSQLNLGKEGLVMTNAALSSTNGVIDFPNARAGKENFGIDSCQKNNDFCEKVPMYSLPTYVETFVNGHGPINILSIDVEGFDFDVLFGAGNVLDRTEYLEFEYHKVGNWGGYHLTDAIRLLDAKGFTCYWAGVNRLWRLTGCQHPLYETWHEWSNVACVHRSKIDLAHIMEQTFKKSIQTNIYV